MPHYLRRSRQRRQVVSAASARTQDQCPQRGYAGGWTPALGSWAVAVPVLAREACSLLESCRCPCGRAWGSSGRYSMSANCASTRNSTQHPLSRPHHHPLPSDPHPSPGTDRSRHEPRSRCSSCCWPYGHNPGAIRSPLRWWDGCHNLVGFITKAIRSLSQSMF